MHQYVALIRPMMEGPYTDLLWDASKEKRITLQNRFRPKNAQLLVSQTPDLHYLRLRARLNNMEMLAFESEVEFTFESLDKYLRALQRRGKLEDFFKKYRIK